MPAIVEKAGVGIGTVYRHFPQRSDLIVALFRHGVDACADAASVLPAEHGPREALARRSDLTASGPTLTEPLDTIRRWAERGPRREPERSAGRTL